MSTQQSAQERAEEIHLDIFQVGHNVPVSLIKVILEEGKRIAMDEMSAKASEGFGEWWDGYIHADTFTHTAKDTWQAGRAPLLARIAELETEQVRHIEIIQEGYSKRITDLEAQNKKLGDVVLEIYGIAWQRGRAAEDVGFITYHYFAKNQELIEQLKQERGDEPESDK